MCFEELLIYGYMNSINNFTSYTPKVINNIIVQYFRNDLIIESNYMGRAKPTIVHEYTNVIMENGSILTTQKNEKHKSEIWIKIYGNLILNDNAKIDLLGTNKGNGGSLYIYARNVIINNNASIDCSGNDSNDTDCNIGCNGGDINIICHTLNNNGNINCNGGKGSSIYWNGINGIINIYSDNITNYGDINPKPTIITLNDAHDTWYYNNILKKKLRC
mmetsp:Transcript_64958/g.79507  ORF Transcript_64958/g.79507 Transcript_64958/m.79507 type:complete len:218 (-) Transcript_64958:51-704(-)